MQKLWHNVLSTRSTSQVEHAPYIVLILQSLCHTNCSQCLLIERFPFGAKKNQNSAKVKAVDKKYLSTWPKEKCTKASQSAGVLLASRFCINCLDVCCTWKSNISSKRHCFRILCCIFLHHLKLEYHRKQVAVYNNRGEVIWGEITTCIYKSAIEYWLHILK
jgi:hypothetical protein